MNFIAFLSKKRTMLLFWFALFFQSYAQNNETPCTKILGDITTCATEFSKSSVVLVSNDDGRKADGYYKKEWIFIHSGKTSSDKLEGPLDWLYNSQLSIGDDRVLLRRKLEFSKPRPGPKSGGQYILNTKIIDKKLPYGLSLFAGHKEGVRMTSDYISLQNSDTKNQLEIKKDKVVISGVLRFNANENDLDINSIYITYTNNRDFTSYGLSVYKGDQEKMRIENKLVHFFSDIDFTGGNMFIDTLSTKSIGIEDLRIGKKLKVGENIDFTSDTEQAIRVSKSITHRINNKENAGFSIENPLGSKILHITLRGKTGIGTWTSTPPEQKLEVIGTIMAQSYIADAAEFPDYVFEKGYDLMDIEKVKKYVRKHKHLPGMPSKKEVIKKGLDIKKMSLLNVEKLEELYLHMFELDKKTNKALKKIDQMESKLNKDKH